MFDVISRLYFILWGICSIVVGGVVGYMAFTSGIDFLTGYCGGVTFGAGVIVFVKGVKWYA